VSGMGVFVSVEGVGTPDVNGVGKGAGGSALTHGLKGFKEMGGGEGDVGDIGIICLRLGVSEVVIWNVRREEFIDVWFECIGVGGKG
jgi:hypothetical protein